MLIRIALLLSAFAAAPALAQASSPPEAVTPAENVVPVAMETSLGRIVVAVDRGHAPVSSANFLKYVDQHRYDGETFYRAMKVGDGGLIQGGVTSDTKKLLAPVAHEPTSKTGLKHVAGAISLANAGPGTARADFFILLSDIPGLDAGGEGGDANGFAVFGRVTEGMDVVKKIFEAPVSPTKGKGIMKGQMLEPPVRILKAARVKPAPPAE
jgi:peptidyl-prolyl cis-trans isomerase A (cyclophilin A)